MTKKRSSLLTSMLGSGGRRPKRQRVKTTIYSDDNPSTFTTKKKKKRPQKSTPTTASSSSSSSSTQSQSQSSRGTTVQPATVAIVPQSGQPPVKRGRGRPRKHPLPQPPPPPPPPPPKPKPKYRSESSDDDSSSDDGSSSSTSSSGSSSRQSLVEQEKKVKVVVVPPQSSKKKEPEPPRQKRKYVRRKPLEPKKPVAEKKISPIVAPKRGRKRQLTKSPSPELVKPSRPSPPSVAVPNSFSPPRPPLPAPSAPKATTVAATTIDTSKSVSPSTTEKVARNIKRPDDEPEQPPKFDTILPHTLRVAPSLPTAKSNSNSTIDDFPAVFGKGLGGETKLPLPCWEPLREPKIFFEIDYRDDGTLPDELWPVTRSVSCITMRKQTCDFLAVGDTAGFVSLYHGMRAVTRLESTACQQRAYDQQMSVRAQRNAKKRVLVVDTSETTIHALSFVKSRIVLSTLREVECLDTVSKASLWKCPLDSASRLVTTVDLHPATENVLVSCTIDRSKEKNDMDESCPLWLLHPSPTGVEICNAQCSALQDSHTCTAIWDASCDDRFLLVAPQQNNAQNVCTQQMVLVSQKSQQQVATTEIPTSVRKKSALDIVAKISQSPMGTYTLVASTRGIRLYVTETLHCLQVFGDQLALHGRSLIWQDCLLLRKHNTNKSCKIRRQGILEFEDFLSPDADSDENNNDNDLGHFVVGIPHPTKGPKELCESLHIYNVDEATVVPSVSLPLPPKSGGALQAVTSKRHELILCTQSGEAHVLAPNSQSDFAGIMYPPGYQVISDNLEYIEDEDELDQVLPNTSPIVPQDAEKQMEKLQEAMRQSILFQKKSRHDEPEEDIQVVDYIKNYHDDDSMVVPCRPERHLQHQVACYEIDDNNNNNINITGNNNGSPLDITRRPDSTPLLSLASVLSTTMPQAALVTEQRKTLAVRKAQSSSDLSGNASNTSASVPTKAVRGKRSRTASVEALLKASINPKLAQHMAKKQQYWSDGKGSSIEKYKTPAPKHKDSIDIVEHGAQLTLDADMAAKAENSMVPVDGDITTTQQVRPPVDDVPIDTQTVVEQETPAKLNDVSMHDSDESPKIPTDKESTNDATKSAESQILVDVVLVQDFNKNLSETVVEQQLVSHGASRVISTESNSEIQASTTKGESEVTMNNVEPTGKNTNTQQITTKEQKSDEIGVVEKGTEMEIENDLSITKNQSNSSVEAAGVCHVKTGADDTTSSHNESIIVATNQESVPAISADNSLSKTDDSKNDGQNNEEVPVTADSHKSDEADNVTKTENHSSIESVLNSLVNNINNSNNSEVKTADDISIISSSGCVDTNIKISEKNTNATTRLSQNDKILNEMNQMGSSVNVDDVNVVGVSSENDAKVQTQDGTSEKISSTEDTASATGPSVDETSSRKPEPVLENGKNPISVQSGDDSNVTTVDISLAADKIVANNSIVGSDSTKQMVIESNSVPMTGEVPSAPLVAVGPAAILGVTNETKQNSILSEAAVSPRASTQHHVKQTPEAYVRDFGSLSGGPYHCGDRPAEETAVALGLLGLSPCNTAVASETSDVADLKDVATVDAPEGDSDNGFADADNTSFKSGLDLSKLHRKNDCEVEKNHCYACQGRLVIHSCGKRVLPVDLEAAAREERDRKEKEEDEKRKARAEKRRQADARRREAKKQKQREAEEKKKQEEEQSRRHKDEQTRSASESLEDTPKTIGKIESDSERADRRRLEKDWEEADHINYPSVYAKHSYVQEPSVHDFMRHQPSPPRRHSYARPTEDPDYVSQTADIGGSRVAAYSHGLQYTPPERSSEFHTEQHYGHTLPHTTSPSQVSSYSSGIRHSTQDEDSNRYYDHLKKHKSSKKSRDKAEHNHNNNNNNNNNSYHLQKASASSSHHKQKHQDSSLYYSSNSSGTNAKIHPMLESVNYYNQQTPNNNSGQDESRSSAHDKSAEYFTHPSSYMTQSTQSNQAESDNYYTHHDQYRSDRAITTGSIAPSHTENRHVYATQDAELSSRKSAIPSSAHLSLGTLSSADALSALATFAGSSARAEIDYTANSTATSRSGGGSDHLMNGHETRILPTPDTAAPVGSAAERQSSHGFHHGFPAPSNGYASNYRQPSRAIPSYATIRGEEQSGNFSSSFGSYSSVPTSSLDHAAISPSGEPTSIPKQVAVATGEDESYQGAR